MSDATNVSYGKPKIGGAVSVASVGTNIPTDATTGLDAAFKSLGYISEEGLANTNSPESKKIKSWGGDTVLVIASSSEDVFKFRLIESLNVDVLKTVYGASNVSGALDTGLIVKANSKQAEPLIYVVDMIMKGGVLKRIVIPTAVISERGEINYSDEDAIGFELTVEAIPDTHGNTHYEYIKSVV